MVNVENILAGTEDQSKIVRKTPVSGGDTNEAWHIETETQRYFLKVNKDMPKDFFEIEAAGLREISSSGTISVPHVFQTGQTEGIPFLLMEWVEGEKTSRTDSMLGEKAGAMHKTFSTRFGYHGLTFIGTLPQKNGWHTDWTDYYKNHRLLPQMKLAIQKGYMPSARRVKMERLLESLHLILAHQPSPSLLHGDLWGGNWIIGNAGEPFLIDPSVLYGDHEFEMAFTELFGGFSQSFYNSYYEVFPVTEEYKDRKPLYQLYYLLAHLNMFGESYGGPVDRILNRYA